jgi:hypothetical protein
MHFPDAVRYAVHIAMAAGSGSEFGGRTKNAYKVDRMLRSAFLEIISSFINQAINQVGGGTSAEYVDALMSGSDIPHNKTAQTKIAYFWDILRWHQQHSSANKHMRERVLLVLKKLFVKSGGGTEADFISLVEQRTAGEVTVGATKRQVSSAPAETGDKLSTYAAKPVRRVADLGGIINFMVSRMQNKGDPMPMQSLVVSDQEVDLPSVIDHCLFYDKLRDASMIVVCASGVESITNTISGKVNHKHCTYRAVIESDIGDEFDAQNNEKRPMVYVLWHLNRLAETYSKLLQSRQKCPNLFLTFTHASGAPLPLPLLCRSAHYNKEGRRHSLLKTKEIRSSKYHVSYPATDRGHILLDPRRVEDEEIPRITDEDNKMNTDQVGRIRGLAPHGRLTLEHAVKKGNVSYARDAFSGLVTYAPEGLSNSRVQLVLDSSRPIRQNKAKKLIGAKAIKTGKLLNPSFVVNASELEEKVWSTAKYLALLVALASKRDVILLTTEQQHRAIQIEVSRVTMYFPWKGQKTKAVAQSTSLRTKPKTRPMVQDHSGQPVTARVMGVVGGATKPQPKIPKKAKQQPQNMSSEENAQSTDDGTHDMPEGVPDSVGDDTGDKDTGIDTLDGDKDTFDLLEDKQGADKRVRIFNTTFALGEGSTCTKLQSVKEADGKIHFLVVTPVDDDHTVIEHRKSDDDVYLMCDEHTKKVSADTSNGVTSNDDDIRRAVNHAHTENGTVYVLCVSS